MFDKFKEEKGGEMMEEKTDEDTNEADEVAAIINNLRDKLSGIDSIVGEEGNRVKQIKDNRDSLEN